MSRSAGTQWKLDQDHDSSQDEFFGLLEEDQLPGSEPVAPGRKARLPFLERLTSLLITKTDQPPEEQLDELIVESRISSRPQAADLEDYITRLDAGRDWDDFRESEQLAPLFQQVQQTTLKRFRSWTWAVWITAATWAYLGFANGQNYLAELTSPDLPLDQLLVDKLGAQAAEAALISVGFLMPVFGFLLTATALSLLIGGIYERRPARAIIGLCGLILVALVLSLAGQGFYLAALISAILGWLLLRGLEWAMARIGIY